MSQSTIDGTNPALEMWCEGYGLVPAQYMFIGISAGQRGALITRVPLTKDASGRLFQRCLGRLQLSLDDEFLIKPRLVDCYITNFVKGRCLTEQGLNRLPTDKEFWYWWPTLEAEIKKVKPRLVVALGDLVYRWLIGFGFLPTEEYLVVKLKHPRWYQSHGALSNKKAFEQMVKDYHEALVR